MIDVVLHAVQWVQDHGETYDAICLLQPTSPLRSARTIDRLLWERGVDSVVSVRSVPSEYNPHWVYFETYDGLLEPSLKAEQPIPSRQELPPAHHRDGSVFVARLQTVISQRSLYGRRMLGFVCAEEEASDLDTEEQWEAVERRMNSEIASHRRS
jgi:CMP-N-acetylneuraminic acid synthetase